MENSKVKTKSLPLKEFNTVVENQGSYPYPANVKKRLRNPRSPFFFYAGTGCGCSIQRNNMAISGENPATAGILTL